MLVLRDREILTELKRYSKAFVLGKFTCPMEGKWRRSAGLGTLRIPASGTEVYFAKSWPMSAKALNSKALQAGSRKNMVVCLPTSLAVEGGFVEGACGVEIVNGEGDVEG